MIYKFKVKEEVWVYENKNNGYGLPWKTATIKKRSKKNGKNTYLVAIHIPHHQETVNESLIRDNR